MRLFYLDPGLLDDVGHHANYCRYIVGELRARGVEATVFGHRSVESTLRSELEIVPHFRTFTYARIDRDPIAGWLNEFDAIASTTREDLHDLPQTAPTDIVYASSVRPGQLLALVDWRRVLSPDRRPTVVVESSEPGLAVTRTPQGLQPSVPSPQVDATATLFRFASKRMPREIGARFHVIAFGQALAQLLTMILEYPARALPLPYPAVIPLRNRAGARPVVVAILGQQKVIKGYDRLPEIVDELLRELPNIRLLLQVVSPDGPSSILSALRAVALQGNRLILEEKPAGKTRWPQLLEMADLVLCPHRPEFYVASFSSVAAEALANGIPLVVPAGTPLETLLGECGGAGTTFDRFEPSSISAATRQALDRFDHFATRAYEAALQWPKTRGPARMVVGLMSLIAST